MSRHRSVCHAGYEEEQSRRYPRTEMRHVKTKMAGKLKCCIFSEARLYTLFSRKSNSFKAASIGRRCVNGAASDNYATGKTTLDDEVTKFNLLSSEWWDQSGDFMVLKAMNRLRIPWIKNTLLADSKQKSIRPLDSFKILDIGCGGGLLSEPLARLGANVTGIDPVASNIMAAKAHANIDENVARNTEYLCSTVEDMVDDHRETFDAVVASEVIEHVNYQLDFVQCCSQLIKPGGHLFVTTINRTIFSLLFAKYAAEYIVRIVPAGVHDWEKFVTTSELVDMLRRSKLEMIQFTGMTYNLVSQKWYWCENTAMNYACHARKPVL
ncbi:ubiquinone biosynthesis O-methyltransferase, mitochondrial-like [Rhopilema esculentum]|uniref:ubiquinone biosynthesis O-methyltransferase, mitochondrial-like n=1 Tax=Rhopilema esculentum TaxID=499914 RepID=UPI0031D4E905|eukprot:gene17401-9001_t